MRTGLSELYGKGAPKFAGHLAKKTGFPSVAVGAPVVVADEAAHEFYKQAYMHSTHPGPKVGGEHVPIVSEIAANFDEKKRAIVLYADQLEIVQRTFKHFLRFHQEHPKLVSDIKVPQQRYKKGVKMQQKVDQLVSLVKDKPIVEVPENLNPPENALKFLENVRNAYHSWKPEHILATEIKKHLEEQDPRSHLTHRYLAALQAFHGSGMEPRFKGNFIELPSVPAGAKKFDTHTHPSRLHPATAAASPSDVQAYLLEGAKTISPFPGMTLAVTSPGKTRFNVMNFPVRPVLATLKKGAHVDEEKAREAADKALSHGILGFRYEFTVKDDQPVLVARPIVTESHYEKEKHKIPAEAVPERLRVRSVVIE